MNIRKLILRIMNIRKLNKKRRLQAFRKKFAGNETNYHFFGNCLVQQMLKFVGVAESETAIKGEVADFFGIDSTDLWDVHGGRKNSTPFTSTTFEGALGILDTFIKR
jgi:hypothetical protein